MDRRDVLRGMAGALGAGALAGCLGGDGDGGGGSGGEDTTSATDTPTDTATPTATPTPSVVDTRIETKQRDCLMGEDDPAVSIELAGGTVTVGGDIRASDPCHEATLSAASYDPESDSLTVTVGVEATGKQACQQCIGAITYEAAVDVSGGFDGSVVVQHDTMGKTTTVAKRKL